MNKKFNVAFIGGGINSEIGLVHKNALDITQKFSLLAGCFSKDRKINKLSGEFFKIRNENIFENLEQLLTQASSQLDALIILTPTNMHFDNIKTILKYKIPIISEKSLVLKSKEINEIKKLINNSNTFLTVTYNYTGYSMIREIQDFIKKGKLGRINKFLIEMPQDSYLRLDQRNNKLKIKRWRLQKYEIPMIFYDLGMHIHSLIKFLFNKKLSSVLSITKQSGNFNKIDDDVHCLLKMKDTSVGNIWFSKSALGQNNGLKLRIFGNKGAVEWYQENPDHFFYYDKYGSKIEINQSSPLLNISNSKRYQRFKPGHPTGFVEAFANYYEDIAMSLENNKKQNSYTLGIETAEEGLKFVESAFLSSKKNVWVQI